MVKSNKTDPTFNKRGNVCINVIVRRVRITIVALEKINKYYIFWVCIRSLSYPACTVIYCHLWPVRLYHIFIHYLIKSIISGRRLLRIKCVLILSTTFVWNISHSKKKWTKYYHKCTLVTLWSACYSRRILMQIGFSRYILEKNLNIKFHENRSSGSRVVTCGGTDRQTWRSYLADFRNFANAPKNQIVLGKVYFLLVTNWTFILHCGNAVLLPPPLDRQSLSE